MMGIFTAPELIVEPDPAFTLARCRHMDPHARVAIKQQAVDDALVYTKKICRELEQHSYGISGWGYTISKELRQWISEAEERRKDNDDFGIDVGVRGATGAGKSSLLNALLDLPEFLPISCEEAGTATASKISWNFDDDPQKKFRAVIKFRTVEDVTNELDQLIDDIKERDDLGEDSEDEEDDANTRTVLDERISEAIDKLDKNWDLDQQKIIDQNLTAAAIVDSNKEASKLLGKTLSLSDPVAEKFSEMIRPYLDSTPTEDGVTAWPLVEEVNLFVQAKILKNGVRLVDLPGASDSVAARCRVAERNSAKLDLTIIVIPSRRAINEDAGVSLISERQQLTAQMGGNPTGPKFCVAISHMDELNSDIYINSKPEIKKDAILKALLDEIEILRAEQISITAEMAEKKEEKAVIDDERAQSIERREIRKLLKKSDEADTIIDALEQGQKEIPTQLEMLEKKKKHRCMVLRNKYQRSKLEEGFQKRQRRLSKKHPQWPSCKEKMDVFPICATAYMALLRDNGKPDDGFPSKVLTGIPRLRQWIEEASVKKREEHLDLLLASFKCLYHDIDQWCDTQSAPKVDFSRRQIEDIIESTYDVFQQKLCDTVARLLEDLKKLIPWGDAEDIAASNDVKVGNIGSQVAASWVRKFPDDPSRGGNIAASTQTSILRKKGGPHQAQIKNVGAVEYDWPVTLLNAFLKLVLPKWTQAFHINMRQNVEPHFGEMAMIWVQLLDEVEGHFRSTSPDIISSFSDIRRSLEEREVGFRKRLEHLFATMCREAGTNLSPFSETIKSALGPIFQAAYGISGDQTVKNRQAKIIPKVRDQSPSIFIEAYKEMITAHEEHVSRFEARAGKHPSKMIAAAQRKIGIMLESLESDKGKDRRIVTTKARLQKNVKTLTMQWDSRWRVSVVVPKNHTTQELDIPERCTENRADPSTNPFIMIEEDEDDEQELIQGHKRKDFTI